MSCAEGLELWGEAPTYSEWSRIRVCRMQVGPVLGDLNTKPPGAPVSHAWAYRDFLDDALAALSVVQRARRLWTLVIWMRRATAFATLLRISVQIRPDSA
ncbi:hypothetical protein CDL15_Pgr022200 [Punica granatum]|uniref:Uncharacterized protein n=1 Tax=Punica granatum TaxID=22663 RepID=A0A218Y533_PUNGR|nr:hypothetical protein CDL15_Pgr022200 [Punica granatum]